MTDKSKSLSPAKAASPSQKIQAKNTKENAKTTNEVSHASRYFKLAFASFFLNIVLAYLAFVYYPQTDYLATANAAAVCGVPTLNKPHVHHAVAADFAVEAALGIYDYNYGNYKRAVTGVTDRYFTPGFRDVFMKAFSNSENIQRVINDYLTVIPGRDGMAAQIERVGEKNGTYFWIINVPLVVHYVSGRKDRSERVLAKVEVIQVDPQVNVRGLAVDSIELKQML